MALQKKTVSEENSQIFNLYEYFVEWQTVHKWGDFKVFGSSDQQL